MTMAQLTGWIDGGASVFYGRIGWDERGLVTELTPLGGARRRGADDLPGVAQHARFH